MGMLTGTGNKDREKQVQNTDLLWKQMVFFED